MKYKVFITKNIPEKGIEILQRAGYEVAVGSNAKGAHAVLSLLTDNVDAKFMDSIGSQLKVISNMAAGLDNVDLDAAKERGVVVRNTPDVLTESVAEHAAALILGITRRVAESDRFVRAGKFKGWDPELFLGIELKGKTLGIVGHGRIGCRLADIMQKGFGMRVIYYDVARDEAKEEQCGITYASLENLLEDSDVVSLHVPLLPSTHHLIGEKELRMMRKESYLINTARGAVVDEIALVKALKEQWIAGAALDVFENEPKLMPGLTKLENIVLSPHLGSATKETRENMAELAAQNIIAVLEKQGMASLMKEIANSDGKNRRKGRELKHRKSLTGFTLIELLVVISVIGLLASIVLVSLKGTNEKGRIAKAKEFSSSISHVLGSEAVGIWRFEETASPSLDSSGYGNSGIWNGGVTSKTETECGLGLGKCLAFDGSSGSVAAGGSSPSLAMGNGSFTITVWIKSDILCGPTWGNPICTIVSTKDLGNSTVGYYLGIGVSRIFFQIGDGTANNGDFTTPYAYVGSWHHVAAVRDKEKSQFLLYFDGAPAGTDPDTFGDVGNTYNLNIGSVNRADPFFNGFLDEVYMFRSALSVSQIQQLYVQGLLRHNNKVTIQ